MKKYFFLLTLICITACNYTTETFSIPVKIVSLDYHPCHIEMHSETSNIYMNGETRTITTRTPVTIPERYSGKFYSDQFGTIYKDIPEYTYKELEKIFTEKLKTGKNTIIYIPHTITHKKDKPVHIKEIQSDFPISGGSINW